MKWVTYSEIGMHLLILAAGQGTRLRPATGPRPKLFLEVGGRTLLDRFLDIAALLNLSPLAVTRAEYEADFRRAGVETLVEEAPYHPLGSLYYARRVLSETFCWVGGDMLFSDPEPLKELLAEHVAGGYAVSSPYCRTDRFKARLRLSPEPQVVITPEPEYPFSIPNFLVHEPKAFSYMMPEPHGEFLQRMIEAGEPVLFREYAAPVFEIDTPEDLAEARRFFQR